MDPMTIIGGAAAGGSIASGLLGPLSSINQARINRRFQSDMSSTAYQRAVADMKKAGLNPLMMFRSGGGPESTPSGAMADTSGFSGIGQGLSSAARLMMVDKPQAQADIAFKQAQERLTNEQVGVAAKDAQLKDALRLQVDVNNDEAKARTLYHLANAAKLSGADTKLIDAQIKEISERTKGYAPQRELTGAQIISTGAGTAKTFAETGLIGAQTNKAEFEAAMLGKLKDAADPMIEWITDMIKKGKPITQESFFEAFRQVVTGHLKVPKVEVGPRGKWKPDFAYESDVPGSR